MVVVKQTWILLEGDRRMSLKASRATRVNTMETHDNPPSVYVRYERALSCLGGNCSPALWQGVNT